MKVLIPGHRYIANNFENPNNGQIIQFILETISDGTTNEELIEILIDRLKFLNSKFPCKENSCCITHLEEGLMWLEKRTKDRTKRNV